MKRLTLVVCDEWLYKRAKKVSSSTTRREGVGKRTYRERDRDIILCMQKEEEEEGKRGRL